jgi:hypothetical protein
MENKLIDDGEVVVASGEARATTPADRRHPLGAR